MNLIASTETNSEPVSPSELRPTFWSTLLGIFLVLLMGWPLLHGQIVVRYGLNPWKGFAIAMYCTRHLVTMEVLAATPRGLVPISSEQLKTPEIYPHYRAYADQRQTLGKLAGVPPVELAEGIFRQYRGLRDVLIRIRNFRLDPRTGSMTVDQKCVYHFRYENGRVMLYDRDEKTELLKQGESGPEPLQKFSGE